MRDIGTDVERLKAVLAVEITGALARERLTVRQAQSRTGIAAADFSRIRNGDLGRFSIDRLMSIVNRLGSRIEFDMRLAQIEIANEPLASHLDPVSREVANVLVGHLANGHVDWDAAAASAAAAIAAAPVRGSAAAGQYVTVTVIESA